jgi:HK97 family phage major capsid protein
MANSITDAQSLFERKGAIAYQIKDLVRRRGDEWNDEDERSFSKMNDELRTVNGQIDALHTQREETREEIERRELIASATGVHPEEQRARSLKWMAAFKDYLCNGSDMGAENRQILAKTHAEQRDQNIGTPADGGYLIDSEFNRNIVEALKNYDVMRRAPTTKVTTQTGSTFLWPTVNDTIVGEILGEAAAADDTAGTSDIVFGQKSIGAFKYSSRKVLVSMELLQDALITDLPGLITRLLAQRIAGLQQTHFTTGGGTTVPWGAITRAPAIAAESANDDTISKSNIIDLYHAVPSQYRERPSVGFMCNDAIAAAIRKLDNSQNNLMWEASLQLGTPDRLMGKPLYENPAMIASISAENDAWMAFGDWSAYVIRDVRGMSMRRLDEVHAHTGQVAFLAFLRSSGELMTAEASGGPLQKIDRAAD